MRNKLKALRTIHNLTQEQLAGRLDVTRQTIIAIENGRYLPSLGLAFKLSRLLKVRIEDLFEYDPE